MDPISSEKRTAMLRYSRLRTITTLLRCIELVAVAILALWSSSYIPAVVRSSGDLLRQLIPILLGPKFLFLIGNAIIVTLLCKSRHLTSTPEDNDAASIGDEISAFVASPPPQATEGAVSPPAAEEVVFEDKRVMCVERNRSPPPRPCRRSKSQKVVEKRSEAAELRRAETDVGKVKEDEDPEEFRRMIEAFIKKQWKFQREESMAIVCADGLTAAGTPEQVK